MHSHYRSYARRRILTKFTAISLFFNNDTLIYYALIKHSLTRQGILHIYNILSELVISTYIILTYFMNWVKLPT